jgi:hypothetical protein
MRALTTMGIGYAITRIPKKIYPFRPVEVVQTSHSIGGKRQRKRKVQSSDEEESKVMDTLPPERTQAVPQTADPNEHVFCRDKNERRKGDCMLVFLVAVTVTLRWRYPNEFTPQRYLPGNAKEVRKWYQQTLRHRTLPALAELDEIDVWIRVKDNFVTNTATTQHQGSDEWYASCVEYVAYDERDTKKCMWFNAEMYPIMLRGILLPGLLTDSFLREQLVSPDTISRINKTWVVFIPRQKNFQNF